jgi:hypothetical protein
MKVQVSSVVKWNIRFMTEVNKSSELLSECILNMC